jgi:hypothetical protein
MWRIWLAYLFGSILFLFCFLIPGGSVMAEQLGTVKGTLLDPQGAAIQNANIELCWNYLDNSMPWNQWSSPKAGEQETAAHDN